MRRLLPLCLIAVCAADAPAPVAPVVHRVLDAGGVPPRSCAEALGEVSRRPASPPSTGASSSVSATPVPDVSGLPQIRLGDREVPASALPGGDPTTLPPQPLEGPPEALARVRAVMDAAAAGERVRVSVFGASHTEGDHWTGHLRRLLQRRHGDVGHGFVLPAALFRGYRAQDVNLCRTSGWVSDYAGKRTGRGDGLLGVMGASLSSADPAQFGWIETTHSNPEGRKVASYDLFTLGQPGGGGLVVQIDEAAPITVSTDADAPRLLRHRFEVPDGGHRFVVRPVGDGEVRVFGISAERPGPGVIVDALGIRGRTARSWLQWDRAMAGEGLATLDPDLVVLAYGTNEAADVDYTMEAYRADLRRVLGELRAAAPDAACVLVGPTDAGRRVDAATYAIWDRTRPVAQAQRAVAPEFDCAFWDWQQAMGGPGSIVAWALLPEPLAARDLIHLTPAGYVLSAERFLAALDASGRDQPPAPAADPPPAAEDPTAPR